LQETVKAYKSNPAIIFMWVTVVSFT